jgi:hypothetical protein
MFLCRRVVFMTTSGHGCAVEVVVGSVAVARGLAENDVNERQLASKLSGR